MTTASKARKALARKVTIDQDDVITQTTQAPVQSAPSTALTLLPVTKPSEQPAGPVQMDGAFYVDFRKAIKQHFNGSQSTVDTINKLGLTVDDVGSIEQLRVIFMEQWIELYFVKFTNCTYAHAIKDREVCLETSRTKRTEIQNRAYTAAKVAWFDVRGRANLIAPKVVAGDNANKGQGSAKGGAAAKSADEATKIDSFEKLAQEAKDIAKYIDALIAQATQAKFKTCGLLVALSDQARAIRVAVHASELEIAADKANK